MYRVAYLLCEVRPRDLAPSLLIATHLLQAGIPVVVGQRWSIVKNRFSAPKGCFLVPTANEFQAAGMAEARQAGHLVVACNEEATVLLNPLENTSPSALSACHRFLVHYTFQRDAMVAKFHDEAAEKLVVTGVPRLELLRKINVEPIGGAPYVLFNTGFGAINSIWGALKKVVAVRRQAQPTPDEWVKAWVAADYAGVEIMSALIRWLAPQHRCVIRPHPSERVQTWRDAFPELEVIERSPTLPWIKGAKAVVHVNSTTGLEAMALGVPALNLDPIPSWGDRYIVKNINYSAATLKEAQKALLLWLRDGAGPLAEKRSLDSAFQFDGAKNTADVIANLLADNMPLSGEIPWIKVSRTEQQREKFTVDQAEVTRNLRELGATCSARELDDSVFLLTPSA